MLELKTAMSQLEHSAQQPIFFPLYSLKNKEHGDIIISNNKLQFVYHDTDKHPFTNHVKACMQQFKNNALIVCINNTPSETQPLIDAEVVGSIPGQHGQCGWYVPGTEEKKASTNQIFQPREKSAPRE